MNKVSARGSTSLFSALLAVLAANQCASSSTADRSQRTTIGYGMTGNPTDDRASRRADLGIRRTGAATCHSEQRGRRCQNQNFHIHKNYLSGKIQSSASRNFHLEKLDTACKFNIALSPNEVCRKKSQRVVVLLYRQCAYSARLRASGGFFAK